MSDDYRRTNAFLAAYREQYLFFTAAQNSIAELLPNLTRKEEAEYRRIQKAVDRFNIEQQSRHPELMAAELDDFTIDQKVEYVARMLALTEQITERLKQFRRIDRARTVPSWISDSLEPRHAIQTRHDSQRSTKTPHIGNPPSGPA